ncbi:MAG: hypothetical protein ACRC2S_08725 [Waterburya sp.]
MSLSFDLKYISIISFTAFIFLVTGQIAQAETPIQKNHISETSNPQQQSNFSPTIKAVNSNNFQQLNSVANLNSSSTPNASNNFKKSNTEIAQTQIEIDPGRETRSGSSYIGLGGNIGFDGETSIGKSSFAVISKIGLTDSISFRPTALIEDDATFTLPLTVDFFSEEVEALDTGFSVAPYVGGGISLDTGEGDTVGIVVTGGLDIPISSDFTANAAANVKFIDSTDVGLLLGVGYNL